MSICRSGVSARLLAVILLCFCAADVSGCGGGAGGAAQPAASRYAITDLTPNNTGTANGINDAGEVVGNALEGSASGPQHAFTWTSAMGLQWAAMLPGATESNAFAVNNSGRFVGWQISGGNFTASQWTAPNTVASLGSDARFIEATAVNDTGIVAGTSQTGAYLWNSGGQRQDLAALIGSPVVAVGGVNSAGQILVQTANSAAAIYTPGAGVTPIPIPTGYVGVIPAGINDSGAIAAYADDNRGNSTPPDPAYPGYGFVRASNGQRTTIGFSAIPAAMNRSGQVVGTTGGSAFVWSQSVGLKDLNTLIAPGSGWSLTNANGINSGGQIVGFGLKSGLQHAFLLTPL